MTLTLGDLETLVARALRDPNHNTWTVPELDDLINEGIDAVSSVYPADVALINAVTLSANVWQYPASALNIERIYRIDVWASTTAAPPAGFQYTLLPTTGDGPNSGWDFFAGSIFLPPNYLPVTGQYLSLFGYRSFVQLSASTDTSDLDTKAKWGVLWYCQYEGFKRLLADRADFQQWQLNSNNTDVTAATMNQMVLFAERQWNDRRQQLRKFRRLG